MNTWVYERTESSLWTVGHYSPDGRWHPDSDYNTPQKAAQRCHWLNGGSVPEKPAKAVLEAAAGIYEGSEP